MGRNKLQEVFSNDPEASVVKQFQSITMEAYKEKWCCTCENYIPVDPYLPGFVTVFPECKLGGLAIHTCDKYQRSQKEERHDE